MIKLGVKYGEYRMKKSFEKREKKGSRDSSRGQALFMLLIDLFKLNTHVELDVKQAVIVQLCQYHSVYILYPISVKLRERHVCEEN